MTFNENCGCDAPGERHIGGEQSTSMSRRRVLGGLLGAGIVTMVGSSPASSALRALAVPGSNDDRVLVNVFLLGGADGLNIVVPHGDDDYYRNRGSIAQQKRSLSDLDGFFGLHQAFKPLYPIYADGEAAFIHATGSPTPEGSHFAAMDDVNFAFGNGGWMERALTVAQQTAPVSGLTISSRSAPALRGTNGGVAFASLDKFRRSSRDLQTMRSALESMYRANGDGLTANATLNAFAAVDTLSDISTSRSGNYPNGKLGPQLREAATLIKADIGVRMISIGYGGWDHHSNESPRMQSVGSHLAQALAAFHQDLGGASSRVMTVVQSEFGRTARVNGSGGTDHGYGTVMTVLGRGLAGGGGGRVHLANDRWVGLSQDKLVRGRNLAVTTDFRAVLSEVLKNHMGIADDGRIFPGYTPQPVGLFAAGAPAPPRNRPTPSTTTPSTSTPTTNPATTPTTTQATTPTTAPATTPSSRPAPPNTSPGVTTTAQPPSNVATTARTKGTQAPPSERIPGRTPTTQSRTTQSTARRITGGRSSGAATQTTGVPSVAGQQATAQGAASSTVVSTSAGAPAAGTASGIAGAGTTASPPALVVTTDATAAVSSAVSTAAVPSTGVASTAAVGTATPTTAAAAGSTVPPSLAMSTGVQQTAASGGGLALGKIAAAAATISAGAAAMVGGLFWRSKGQPSADCYPVIDADQPDQLDEDDAAWFPHDESLPEPEAIDADQWVTEGAGRSG